MPLDTPENALLVPARMVNEYVYCPRLCYLEWIGGEWADSADTEQGRFVHRRVDTESGTLPAPGDDGQTVHAQSVLLSSDADGIIARIDLIEGDGSEVMPVDYKKGPARPGSLAWDADSVQLCAQGLILRDAGYTCTSGVLYHAATRTRIEVVFDEALIARTRSAIAGMRAMADAATMPPPLTDSPKCPGCSLVGICLPERPISSRMPQEPHPVTSGA